jgi:serine/threonine protein kinase
MALLTEGQVIRDTYTVERFLGEGAFAEVYRVQHRFLGRQAMKVLKLSGGNTEEIEALLAEALLLSRIGHPNIVRVFNADIFEVNGARRGFFTMEYIAGGSLDRYWQSYRNAMMPIPEVVEIMKQVCAGVAVAHSENPPIVHRDIKPQNIMVGYDGAGLRVRVSDFGLAKQTNPLTLLVSAKGTLSFKPPEAFQNQDSPAADVWAIGTTFYLLLTDTLPYPGLNDRDIADANRFIKPLRPPSIYNMAVDPALEAILSRCLTPKPADRYQNASSLLDDLVRWHPTGASAVSPVHSGDGKEHKSTFGSRSGSDIKNARQMIQEAIAASKKPDGLGSAADLLEEAINKSPELREQYESQLKLWRRGVCM